MFFRPRRRRKSMNSFGAAMNSLWSSHRGCGWRKENDVFSWGTWVTFDAKSCHVAHRLGPIIVHNWGVYYGHTHTHPHPHFLLACILAQENKNCVSRTSFHFLFFLCCCSMVFHWFPQVSVVLPIEYALPGWSFAGVVVGVGPGRWSREEDGGVLHCGLTWNVGPKKTSIFVSKPGLSYVTVLSFTDVNVFMVIWYIDMTP